MRAEDLRGAGTATARAASGRFPPGIRGDKETPLAKGDRVPPTLRFERAGELQVELEVQAGDATKAHH